MPITAPPQPTISAANAFPSCCRSDATDAQAMMVCSCSLVLLPCHTLLVLTRTEQLLPRVAGATGYALANQGFDSLIGVDRERHTDEHHSPGHNIGLDVGDGRGA